MDVNHNVYAIHEWTPYASLVGSHAGRWAGALVSVVAQVSAGTGVGSSHQLKIARKDVHAIDPHDSHLMVLKGLAQRLQGICRELGKLV